MDHHRTSIVVVLDSFAFGVLFLATLPSVPRWKLFSKLMSTTNKRKRIDEVNEPSILQLKSRLMSRPSSMQPVKYHFAPNRISPRDLKDIVWPTYEPHPSKSNLYCLQLKSCSEDGIAYVKTSGDNLIERYSPQYHINHHFKNHDVESELHQPSWYRVEMHSHLIPPHPETPPRRLEHRPIRRVHPPLTKYTFPCSQNSNPLAPVSLSRSFEDELDDTILGILGDFEKTLPEMK
jgi:hypothetical protein